MRAIPEWNNGTGRLCTSTQVLGEVRRRGPGRERVGSVGQIYGIVTAGTAVFCVEGFMSGRKRGDVEPGWTGLKEERLAMRHRLSEIKVTVQLVETGRRREIGGSHQSRGRRDRR